LNTIIYVGQYGILVKKGYIAARLGQLFIKNGLHFILQYIRLFQQ